MPRCASKASIVDMTSTRDAMDDATPRGPAPATFAATNQKAYVKMGGKMYVIEAYQIFLPTPDESKFI